MTTTGILRKDNSAVIIVDVQERLLPVIHDGDKMIAEVNKLIDGSRILNIPLVFTEQYPKGLGITCAEVHKQEEDLVIEKISFSCLGEESFTDKLKDLNAKHLIVAGAEAHICVLNTVLEAIDQGYTVHVVADAIASRTVENRKYGIERMRQSGAYIVTVEMILFQLLREAGTETFKKISQLIK